MSNLNVFLTRCLLAVSLAAGAAAVEATPVAYHVVLDTTSVQGDALLNLSLSGAGNSHPVTATLTHFTGSFGNVYEAVGAVTGDIADGVTLTNATFDNYLTQFVLLGGLLGFDIAFDAGSSDPGTQFSAALYLPAYADFALGTDNLVMIDLTPDGQQVTTPGGYASVTPLSAAIPEPAVPLLMATGLLLCVRSHGGA